MRRRGFIQRLSLPLVLVFLLSFSHLRPGHGEEENARKLERVAERETRRGVQRETRVTKEERSEICLSVREREKKREKKKVSNRQKETDTKTTQNSLFFSFFFLSFALREISSERPRTKKRHITMPPRRGRAAVATSAAAGSALGDVTNKKDDALDAGDSSPLFAKQATTTTTTKAAAATGMSTPKLPAFRTFTRRKPVAEVRGGRV